MAAYQKHNNSAVFGLLRHNNRETKNPSNVDIDPKRKKLNYSLAPPDRSTTLTSKAYYENRLNEVYHYKRDTLITCDEWIVTAPTDLPQDQEKIFFEKCYEFLNSKYSEQNCIQCTIHYDEGIKDGKGNIIHGKPHMHYMYIPVVPYTGSKNYTEKVCNKELMTKSHLLQFHPELQDFLANSGVHCNVNSGITNGVNRSVHDLKAKVLRDMLIERDKNIEVLKSENYQLRHEVEVLREKTYQLETQKNISTRRRFGELEREEEIEY